MVEEVKSMPEHTAPDQPLRSNEFLEGAMRRWGTTVLRLALSHMGNPTDAEDVFQDVFIRLMKDTTRFSSDEHLKAWLLRVTINRCYDIRKSGWKRRNEPLNERHVTIEAPDLFNSDIWEAVEELPFDLRTVFHLFYVEGYSTAEIAHIVDCRPSTARTRLHRARGLLKTTLVPRAYDSGKEDHHDLRPAQRICLEDAGCESIRPSAR